MNTLYYGDNLDILQRYIKDESVDLVYLDPPFNSNATYNVLFAQKDGSQSSAQIQAFEDTWQWDQNAIRTYELEVQKGGAVADALRAFYLILGNSNMMAYLTMMAPRLQELQRVLKPTGSLYLHCDPTASHYLKVLLDMVFGKKNFLNDIIWQRFNFHADANRWGRLHDVILFYCKEIELFKHNPQRKAYDDKYIKSHFKLDENGRMFRLDNPLAQGQGSAKVFFGKSLEPPKGSHWRFSQANIDLLTNQGLIVMTSTGKPSIKRYLDEMEGQVIGDVWADISAINSQAAERMGYPTQKPVALLERILQASSNPGDVVLDPFCGCGTALHAAQKLGRQWIGIDITHLAIGLIKRRMEDAFGTDLKYEVIGEPTTVEGARELSEQDKYQFQWWALGLVGARPAEGKKDSDRGIDGQLYFFDDASRKTKQVIISVKGGQHITVNQVRDLVGVLDREGAQIGVFITLDDPTKPMRAEAAQAGYYYSPGWSKNYPRLQILTIAELLEGKTIDMPPIKQVNQTFKKANREKQDGAGQMELLGE